VIVAVFSDVHANLPALDSFIAATRCTADAYLCLGDVVNYGPWNDECLEAVHSLPGIVLLEGNHERLFNGVDPIAREKSLVQDFFCHSSRFFSRRDLIAALPHDYRLGTFVCTHTIDGDRVYPDTQIEVGHDYIVGHTHHQFAIERFSHTIVNAGSVGQNRRCINVISYALYDTQTGRVTLCGEKYRFDLFLSELEARKYPQNCIDYYARKPRQN
jgi:predicted phosphodiesterase